MIKHNIRTYAFGILGLAIATFCLLYWIKLENNILSLKETISVFSSTATINIIVWGVFISIGWKWKIFRKWLVQMPYLAGDWKGELISNSPLSDGKPIPTQIKITQNFFNIQVSIKTGESKSKSISASFDIDIDRGLQRLIYSYHNTPKASVRERSALHYGTTILEFDGFEVTELQGNYWTDRETTGEIKFEKVKKE
jgi:hypothetical protein